MPINPENTSKLQELAEIIAIEAANKLTFVLNKTAKVTFQGINETCILENKFITKKDCFLFNSVLENSEHGSISTLAANELVFCVADLVMGGEGIVPENVQPDETNQSVFENTAASLIDSVIDRLNSFKEDLGLKIKEHKQKKLLKSKSSTLEIPDDLKDPVVFSFHVKIPSRIDLTVDVELNAPFLDYLAESLSEVLAVFDIQSFESKVKTEYFGDTKPKEEEEEKPLVVDEAVDKSKEVDQSRNLGFLKDINLDLIVELGRVQMPIKEVLRLVKGSAIELDRPSNHPVDLYVHNQLVARGEIVAVDDCFGLKVTEVLGKLDLGAALK